WRAASCCRAAAGTDAAMYCLRCTPTAPPPVVCTAAHPASTASVTAPQHSARRRRILLFAGFVCFMFMFLAKDRMKASFRDATLCTMTQGVIHQHDGQQ